MNHAPLTNEEVRNAFYSLKTNICPGYDDISFNAINNVFDFVVEPLRYIFSNSLVQRIFPEQIEIAQITPISKGGDKKMLQSIGQYLSAVYFKYTRKSCV